MRLTHEDVQKLSLLSSVVYSYLLRMTLDEVFQLPLQVCYPLHCEEGLERRMLHGIRYIGQSVVG